MSASIRILIFCSLFFIFFSCKRTETAADTGTDYFPLKPGLVKIYSVDSVIYSSLTNKKDSARSWLKEIITYERADSNGYKIYHLECYKTRDTAKGWQFSSYYFYRKNEYHINLIKGGNTVTSFVFPVTKNRRWNKNLYNTDEPVFAWYSFVGAQWQEHKDCAEVFVKEDINIIEESVDKEVYARDTGLVYKIMTNIRKDGLKKDGLSVTTRFCR